MLSALNQYNLDLDIHWKIMNEQRVRDVHALGKEVNVWTVNSLEDAQYLARWGVDYITTNIIE